MGLINQTLNQQAAILSYMDLYAYTAVAAFCQARPEVGICVVDTWDKFVEELRKAHDTPQVYQFYFHKDRGLNRVMLQRAKDAGIEVMMLTVDSITGGNRERDLRTGFSIPFRLTLAGMLQFAIKPMWGINYVTHERFKLPQLDEHVDMSGGAMSIGRYFTDMLDPSMNWTDVADMVRHWNGQFCLKGVMSVADAKHAVEIGCTGIIVSNHGGRQLDGSRASFDQLAEIVDAVGDRIDVLMDGGVQRGSHVLKALSVGAKAVGIGRCYLYPLAAAGQAGVERALGLMRAEIERDMKLMGCPAIGQLSRDNLRFR
jgi:L-lactate dehydrogenase (cytochrome)